VQEKESSILAFLSKTSSQEIRFSHFLLLSSRLTENLTWGTATPPPPQARVQQGAGWMDGGLRTPLQALNHHNLSSVSTSPLPSSVT